MAIEIKRVSERYYLTTDKSIVYADEWLQLFSTMARANFKSSAYFEAVLDSLDGYGRDALTNREDDAVSLKNAFAVLRHFL